MKQDYLSMLLLAVVLMTSGCIQPPAATNATPAQSPTLTPMPTPTPRITPPPALTPNPYTHEISACGTNITSSGNYTLSSNLSQGVPLRTGMTCLLISSDNVVFDCKGHEMEWMTVEYPFRAYVIQSGRDNITIKNCVISRSFSGIGFSGSGYVITGNRFVHVISPFDTNTLNNSVIANNTLDYREGGWPVLGAGFEHFNSVIENNTLCINPVDANITYIGFASTSVNSTIRNNEISTNCT